MTTYYISKNGNNANSGLSLALAKRTMFDAGANLGALEAASSGDTILFDDGVYVDSEIESSAGVACIVTAKGIAIDSVNPYGATIASSSTGDSIVKTSGSFSGLTLTFGKITLSGYGGYLPPIGIKFSPTATATLDLGGVVINAVSTRSVYLSQANTVTVTIRGDGVTINDSPAAIYAPTLGPADILLKNVKCINNAVTTNTAAIYLKATAAGSNIQIINPVINSNLATAFPDATYSAIQIISSDNALVYNPFVTLTTDSVAAGHGGGYGVEMKSASTTITAHNNRIIGGTINIDVFGGIGALVGTDGATAYDNKSNSCVIKGVTVNCGSKFEGAGGHGVMGGNNTGTLLQGNIVKGASLGVLLKATTTGLIIGNKTYNCTGKHIYLKGCTSCNVESNESYLATTDTGSALYFGVNIATNNATCLAKNNIIVGSGVIAAKYVTRDASQDVTLSNNLYITDSDATLPAAVANVGATDYATVAAYLAAVEANGGNLSERPNISILECNASGLFISPVPGLHIPI